MLDADAVETDWSNRGRAGTREPRTPNAAEAGSAWSDDVENSPADEPSIADAPPGAEASVSRAPGKETTTADVEAMREEDGDDTAMTFSEEEEPIEAPPLEKTATANVETTEEAPRPEKSEEARTEKGGADWDSDKRSFAERVAAARAATSITESKEMRRATTDADAAAEAEDPRETHDTSGEASKTPEDSAGDEREKEDAPSSGGVETRGVHIDAIPRPAAPPGWWDAHAWPPVAALRTEPSSETGEAYWQPSAEQMADASFAADDAETTEEVSSRAPAPDSDPGATASAASESASALPAVASERERYASMLRARTSAARATRDADESWDYVFEPGDFELCTPRAPTREEKERFGREYRYLAQNKDGLASDWCDAVFSDGREDPSGACEAMADDEKWAEATRLDMRPPTRAAFMGAPSEASADASPPERDAPPTDVRAKETGAPDMPPPPPPPPPPTAAEGTAEGTTTDAEDAEVREPQWRPPQFSVWPRVPEEGDDAADGKEAPAEQDDPSDASSFEARAEDFAHLDEGVPVDGDDDEWNDAGEGYSSERPWDASREEDPSEREEDEEHDEASDADFFERVEQAARAEQAETSSDSRAADSGNAEELDASLPPELPEDKPKGKSKWARLRDD